MPFDNTNFAERYLTSDPTASAFESFVPGPEGARRLARALRREMPCDFTWDFNHTFLEDDEGCGTAGCAFGLACFMWPSNFDRTERNTPFHLQMSENFDMEAEIADIIFYSVTEYNNVDNWNDVTPTMVADAIDKWLVSIGERTSQE